MNSSGLSRGMMSKSLKAEQFIIHVISCIEKEIQEWNPNFNVMLLKLQNYELFINGKESYQVTISESEARTLQHQSPYSLDRRIWLELKEQGLEIIRGYGNYLDYVFSEKQ